MPVEVDETQLQNMQAVAKIAQGALTNPKTRKKFLEAIKESHPDIPIPELDAAAPVSHELDGLKKFVTEQFDSFRKERDEERNQSAIDAVKKAYARGRSELSELGYTDDGISAVEKFMESKGITDWDVARKAYEYDNPRPAPARPSRGNMFDMVESKANGDEYIKKLFETGGQDESVIDQQVSAVLSEARQGLGAMRR